MGTNDASDYALRAARSSDHGFLRAAHHAGLRPWIERTWSWDERQQDEIHAERMGRRGAHMQIVSVAGQDVGYLDVDLRETPWKLNSIVLVPAAQGRGIGSRVVRDILANARAAGVPMTLQVLVVNPARRLYERLGFRQTGATETHIQMQWTPAETKPR